ncbi:MAG: hypothetical protein IPG50_02755 [Myxococcales bacterium]|nr:hypothetical protein [Myxococcales bacterium]
MRPLALVLLVGLSACGGQASETPGAKAPVPGPATSQATSPDGAIRAFKVGADSLKADKVGGSDGALKPDGSPDHAFTAEIDGPVTAVFLASTNAAGEPNGEYQADSVTGVDQIPKDFPLTVRAGMLTAGVGVWEGDKLVNRPDGSIEPLGAGTHRLTLYVASTGILQPGVYVRLYALRPDKSVVRSAALGL